MGGDIEEPVLEDALDAVEHVLDLQLLDLCDVELLAHGVEVVLFDEIDFVLIGFAWSLFLAGRRLALDGYGWLAWLSNCVFGVGFLGDIGWVGLLHCLSFIISYCNAQPSKHKVGVFEASKAKDDDHR